MKIILSYLIVHLSSCLYSAEMPPRVVASEREQVSSILERLAADPIAIPSVQASNRLLELKDKAIPILLHMLPTLNYRDKHEVRRIGAACAVLGTNAYPLLKEVIKGLASEDFPTFSGTVHILFEAGSSAFPIMIEFQRSHTPLLQPKIIKETIMGRLEVFPADSLKELIRLYRTSNKSPEMRRWLEVTFKEGLSTNECELVIPILSPLLKEDDPYILLVVLDYMSGCGLSARALEGELNRLYTSPYLSVRSKATNMLQALKAPP